MRTNYTHTSNKNCFPRQNVRICLVTKPHRDFKTGFTLIELLVVIAIISMLLAIIVPALKVVKEKGAMAVCLYNVRQFSTAWFNYQVENKGELVNPNIGDGSWVAEPETANGTKPSALQTDPPVTDEDEQRGIEKGTLFPYLKAYDVYRCPGDRRLRRSMCDHSSIFRTYAIATALGGGASKVKKYNEISTPGRRYNFVEEADYRNFNVGPWDIIVATSAPAANAVDRGWLWQDPIGVNHGDSGVLGWCDGHAESHKWVDPWTKQRVAAVVTYYEAGKFKGYGEFERANFNGSNRQFNDLNYMVDGWADRKFPK
jgi:prepilin-type N-terminal cleavage/methylation domain-containing protein